MKILTDEMVNLLRESMDAYVESNEHNAIRYADRMFATVEAVLSLAEDMNDEDNRP